MKTRHILVAIAAVLALASCKPRVLETPSRDFRNGNSIIVNPNKQWVKSRMPAYIGDISAYPKPMQDVITERFPHQVGKDAARVLFVGKGEYGSDAFLAQAAEAGAFIVYPGDGDGTMPVLLNCVSGYFFHNENVSGYNAYQFFFLYILGSWIRKDTSVRSRNTGFYLALFVLASLLVSALAVGILHFTDWSLRSLFYYNNPLIVIASAALFIVFTKLDFKSRGVNLLSSTVVAALFVQHILFLTASPYIRTHSEWLTILYLPVIFAAAFIIEHPREILTDHLLNSLPGSDSLSERIIQETNQK